MSRKKIKIALTGGGTGGHITPLIAVLRQLNKLTHNLKFVYIGPTRNLKGLLKKENINVWPLFTGRLRRYLTVKAIFLNFIDFFKILFGFLQAIIYLIIYRPNIIFSKGGYGSFPTIVWAWIFRIPTIAHESDSVPGATNKLLARFATKIVTSFPGEYKNFSHKKLVCLGTPIRDMTMNKQDAKTIVKVTGEKPVIFITGASQGAVQINHLVLKNLEVLLKKYEIIHQVGDRNYKKIEREIKKLSISTQEYHLYAFLDENQMKAAYNIASLVVSRASSTNIFEIAALGKPSILIPLPTSASGHQLKNAQIYEKAGACIVLDPFSVTPNQLLNTINQLMANKKRLQTMSEAALRFSKPHAARDIAKLILKTVDDKQK